MMLDVKNLSVKYGETEILNDINFNIDSGDWLMIIGPNGAGKTTIAKAISQSISYSGEIIMNNKNVSEMDYKEKAKNIGVLMQNHYVAYSYTVKEVVSLGTYSRREGFFSRKEKGEKEKINEALEKTGLLDMKDRSILTLSGGEIQRTFLSQLLLQNPKLMILDEPTNHLDLVYQEEVFELIDKWRKEKDRAVISVVHDLRLARAYGNKVLLLDKGEVFSFGDTEDVMTRENLKNVYNIDVYRWMNELNEKWED